MAILLPSYQVQDYCKKKKWHGNVVFRQAPLQPKDAQSGRALEPLPQKLKEDDYFVGMVYYPCSPEERSVHAFWDCLGETIFKPSDQLFVALFCSRRNPCTPGNSSLMEILHGIKEGYISLQEFPHQLFDRWDITVHEPNTGDYDGGTEPRYAARFALHKSKLQNEGYYSDEDTEGIKNWGKPCLDTLLMSPSAGKKGTFFREEIDVYKDMSDDKYRRVSTKKSVATNITLLLEAFSEITSQFHEGRYNAEHGEMQDFGTDTQNAIMVAESLTGKPSKLDMSRRFSKN